jgi:hypothetical protein
LLAGPNSHHLSLSKHLQPAAYRVQVLKFRAYPQSTMLRWQHPRENPQSRIAHLRQFVKPRQTFRSLSSRPLSNRRPRGICSIPLSRWPKYTAGLRPTEQTSLAFRQVQSTNPASPVYLSKTTWFRTQWAVISQPIATATMASDR